MARPREFDIDKATQKICEKFWANGYEATGVTDLVEATGVARASLYSAFGSKREMLHKAIDYYLAEWIERMVNPVDSAGVDGATGIFRRFALVRETKPERAVMGCLMVNSIVELANDDPEVMKRGERYRNRIRRAFRSAFAKAVEDGEMEGPVDARADLALIMLMGLFVSIKGKADLNEIKRLCNVAIDAIEA